MNNLYKRLIIRSLFSKLAMLASILFLVNGSVGQDSPSPTKKSKTSAFRSTGNKQLDQMKQYLVALENKTRIKVKIKTFDDAKREYEDLQERFGKLASFTNAENPEQVHQTRQLKNMFKEVNYQIEQIEKDITAGLYSANGAKERLAVLDSKLNRLIFKLYREGMRARLLAKMWEFERKRAKLKFEIKPKDAVVFQYEYTEVRKKDKPIKNPSLTGNVEAEVKVPIGNAGANSQVYKASFKPILEAKAIMTDEHNVVISFRLVEKTPPEIDSQIKRTLQALLRTEARQLVLGHLGRSGYKRFLSIEEITKLRTDRKLEIDLSGSTPFQNTDFSLWKQEKKAVLVLTLKPKRD